MTRKAERLSEQELAAAEFVGLGEVGDILGVSKQRAYQLSQSGQFPPQAFRLRATPVWYAADVRRYADSRRKIPWPVPVVAVRGDVAS